MITHDVPSVVRKELLFALEQGRENVLEIAASFFARLPQNILHDIVSSFPNDARYSAARATTLGSPFR
jgi:hypothetical protein